MSVVNRIWAFPRKRVRFSLDGGKSFVVARGMDYALFAGMVDYLGGAAVSVDGTADGRTLFVDVVWDL